MSKEVRVGGARIDIVANTAKFDSGLRKAQGSLAQFERSIKGVFNKLADPRILAGGAITAAGLIGAAALKIGVEFDKAFSTIERKTGATGKALQGLKNDFNEVFRTGDDSVSEVATVISDLNTRLGLTGKPLQALSAQFLDFSDVTGSSIKSLTQSITRLYGDWSIQADEAARSNDYLYKISQQTGIEVTKLADGLVQYGAPLRQLGFTFEEAAAMMGKFEKEGVNTELVLSAMRQSIPRLVKTGLDLKEAFAATVEVIKETKDATEATQIGMSIFGARMGSDMVAAIREGRLNLDELITKLNESGTTIEETAKNTQTLAQKWQELFNTLESGFAGLGSQIVDFIKNSIDFAIARIEDFRRGWEFLQGLKDDTILGNLSANPFSGFVESIKTLDGMISKTDELTDVLEHQGMAAEIVKQENEQLAASTNKAGQASQESKAKIKAFAESLSGEGKSAAKSAKEAAQAIDQLAQSLASAKSSAEGKSISDAISSALDSNNFAALDKLKDQLYQNVYAGVLAGEQDAIAKGGEKAKDLAEQLAAFEADQRVKEIDEKVTEKMKDSYQESVDFWQNIFENAITGTTFSLEDALKQIAVGFAAQLMAGLTQGIGGLGSILSGITSPQGLGGSLANWFLGDVLGVDIGGAASSAISSITGISAGAGLGGLLGSFGGGAGALLADGSIVAAGSEAAAGAIGSAVLPGAGILGALTPWGAAGLGALAIGGTMFGSDIGGLFDSSPKNPETLGRIEIEHFLEDLLKQKGAIQFTNSQGALTSIDNIELGSSGKFNKPGWAQAGIDTYGNATVNAFSGIGKAIAQLAGVTEDVGTQMGFVLMEQMGGSLEGLSALVDKLGISFEDFSSMLIEQGKSGAQSWLEIVSEIRDANDVFGDGLPGLADYGKAMDNLINSAGKGQFALSSAKDLAIEAQEAGITTIEGLVNKLAELGEYSDVELAAILQSAKDNGIDTLDELANASDMLLAQFIAGMDAFMQDHGVQWSSLITMVDEFAGQINALNGKQIGIDINVETHYDKNTNEALNSGLVGRDVSVPAFASGGVVTSPTLGIFGEAGAEAILPLARGSNGKLGVTMNGGGKMGGDVVIHVDARGADPGVESRLMSIIPAVVEQAMREMIG